MQKQTKSRLTLTNLKHLPSYADYLIKHCLKEYAEQQIKVSRELNLPLLKAFAGMPEEQLVRFVMEAAKEFLTYLANNKAEQQIEDALIKWIKNKLPVIHQDDIIAEDITLLSLVRKQTFLYFLPGYCNDTKQMLQLIAELDLYVTKSETESTNTFIDLLRNRIQEQSYLTEKITNTSPSIIYLFNTHTQSITFANQTAEEFFGLTEKEFIAMGNLVIPTIIHPDDIEPTIHILLHIAQAKEEESWMLEHRLKNKEGQYIWMRNYSSVFKRDENGYPLEIIGNILNIQVEKETAEQLKHREEQLLEAQEIAQIGSYNWSLTAGTSTGTPEVEKILDVDMSDHEAFLSKVHPMDRQRLEEDIRRSLETGQFESEFRYKTTKGDKVIWSRGIVYYKDGKPDCMRGTVMDVTERSQILEQLRRSTELYEQAQALSHLGHFTLNLSTNELFFTEELNRIYGFDVHKRNHHYKDIIRHRHPDDNDVMQERIRHAIETHQPFDFQYRIITNNTQKTLHALGGVVLDENKNAVELVGTIQDVTERQSLIEKLQQSEQLYKQAQALAHIGNWYYNIKTGEVRWSDELYNIYDLPIGETITYQTVADFVHPDEREAVAAYIDYCINNRITYDRHHRILLKNGKIKTIHRRAEIITDASGKELVMMGTTQDVTEQQRIQQELKDNQTFIRKITDATPSIITSYNINTGKYVFISEGLDKLLGYDNEAAMQEGIPFFLNIIHPEDAAMIAEKNSNALQTANDNPDKNDIVVEFTYRMRHKNGDYRWFHTYGTIFDRNSNGQVEHVLNISLDVTGQIEASQKIAEQEHFIQHIADASPTVLYVYDVERAGIAYVNREIFFVLGYTPEEIIQLGSSVTDAIYHPDDIQLLPERVKSEKKISESDIMLQYECRLRHKDGEWQWFLVREVVFKTDADGKVAQIVGAALDISKRKEMEKTLLHNSFQLEQSNASLEEFAYVASHDLKEPLRKISTFGDRLMNTQAESLNQEGKIYLRKIVDASQRMQTMISDLLSISMISGNRSYEPYSLERILEETVQTLEFKIEQKNAKVIADNLPVANIVPSQFRQLFQNLLSNSLKFVQEDKQPLITIKHTYLLPEEMPLYGIGSAGRYLKIEFKDNGIGFENEFAGRIFAIFQRLHGRSEYEGSGIGLAICKKIVEHHGGLIYASGAPDEGATFTIILPA